MNRYNIYPQFRAIKLAFLVQQNENSIKIIDAIIRYCQTVYSGRLYPIILFDLEGNTSEQDWDLLESYDPDIILVSGSPSEVLVKKIDRQLSPIYVGMIKNNNIYSSIEPLKIFATKNNISRISRSSRSKFVIFKKSTPAENDATNFISRNFGDFNNYFNASIDLEPDKKVEIKIDDQSDLLNCLGELSTKEYHVFQSQLSSQTLYQKLFVYENIETENFIITVGDSPSDIVSYWNSIFSINSDQGVIKNLWIPSSIIHNGELQIILKNFLKKLIDPWGNQNKKVIFNSTSIGSSELNSIASTLVNGTYNYFEIKQNFKPTIKSTRNRAYFIINQDSADGLKISSKEERIKIDNKNLNQINENGNLMADVYIQPESRTFENIESSSFWYQFPRKNEIAQSMFKNTARIDKNGVPAVPINPKNPTINIKIINEEEIFRILFVSLHSPIMSDDLRKINKTERFYEINYSDKGKYLKKIIHLFSGLGNAYEYLKIRYWRKFLSLFLKDNPNIKSRITATVKKIIERSGTPPNEQFMVKKIYNLLGNLTNSQKYIDFEKFKEIILEELKEIPKHSEQFSYTPEQLNLTLKRLLSDLVEMKIILMGINTRCVHCGMPSWHHLNEIKHKMTCQNCSEDIQIRAEEKWRYKLNSLIQLGLNYQGLIPEILVLGSLLRRMNTSFMYLPNIELYEKDHKSPSYELDLIAIVDGQVIIGEIKQDINDFDDSDFKKLKEVAMRILPDKILLSAMSDTLNQNNEVFEKIKKMNEELKINEIEVCWHPLPTDIFESSFEDIKSDIIFENNLF